MKQYPSLPHLLKQNGLFCCWNYEDRQGQEKPTKVPYHPISSTRARSNDMGTFVSFEKAMANISRYSGLGMGVFNGFCAMDLDNCFEDSGNIKTWAQDVANRMQGCYMEKSPSGKGLHILFKAPGFVFDKQRYYINNQKLGLEVYVCGATSRFVTISGDVYQEGGILDKAHELQAILDAYMLRRTKVKAPMQSTAYSYLADASILQKAMAAQNGKAFTKLWHGDTSDYASQSEADLAMCNFLGFWCGKDTDQMDRLFRQSGLFRDKWDRPQSGSTYGQITIQKAVSSMTETYSPSGRKEDAKKEFQSDDILALQSLAPHSNPRYARGDIGNGNLFSDFYKDVARYVPERKQWLVFDGKAWRTDTGNLKVMGLCKRLADALIVYALSISDEQTRTSYINFAKRWQNRKNRETVLKDAQDVYPLSMSRFDANPYLFNCANGTLDLHHNRFYPHEAKDFITKVSGVVYDPKARCQRWERFVTEIMSGDMERAVFVQKCLGYALTGDTRHETMFILYGPTSRNGKGTMMETFLKITGDYGKTCRPETIGMKTTNSSNNPSEDVARLAGARFVNISEPDKKLTLSAALLKTLTGNDTINARFLHENSFDFRPQFKIFINTNHLPAVTDLTLLSSGRVKIVPFTRHFGEHERDPGLKAAFSQVDNLSGILNWCMDGYRSLLDEGFGIPPSVSMATAEYHHENDKVGLFIEECLVAEALAETRTSDVYASYQNWCNENGYYAESIKNFKAALANVVTIERKRPRSGGEKTTLVLGFRLVKGREFLS